MTYFIMIGLIGQLVQGRAAREGKKNNSECIVSHTICQFKLSQSIK